MTFRKLLPTIFLSFLAATGAADAKSALPAAPSKLKVTALGVNAFQLKWQDNSNNENGWEILVALKGNKPQHFRYIPQANLTSYTVFTNDLPNYGVVFQLAAYTGVPGKEQSGARSEVVASKGQPKKTFGRPSGLTATTLDDSRIRLLWDDNATTEGGYQIQFREKNAKEWLILGTVETALKYDITARGLAPGKDFQFRVRAFSPDGAKSTKFSNLADGKTGILVAPVTLQAFPKTEGSFYFKWKDGSTTESGFELQQAIGNGKFKAEWTFGGYNSKNTTLKTTLKGLPLDQDLRFRIRAYYTSGGKKTYSKYSNIVSSRSTKLNRPTAIVATRTTESSLTLKWKDKSVRESGYRIDYRKVGTSKFLTATTAANATSAVLTRLDAATEYEFRVLATHLISKTVSSAPALVRARTNDSLTGDLNLQGTRGVPFSYQIQLATLSGLSKLTVTGLPVGLTFNEGTRTIAGTVGSVGVHAITLTAKFKDGSTSVRTPSLRINAPPFITPAITAPIIGAPFPVVAVEAGSSEIVELADKFSDPDTLSAARFETTSGSFDIIFYPTDAPLTVHNFMDYMDAGKYDTMFFHRAAKDFVVQGGGYQYDSATDTFAEVEKSPAVTNETKISNTRGTVAMAKSGGDPNSATSEWFVSLKDNTANLDQQNGGFTVFGRVPESGMAVFDAINEMPSTTYEFPLTSGPKELTDVPVDADEAPAVLDPATLVKITSAGAVPLLTYSVVSLDPEIATAAISDGQLVVAGGSSGVATLEVTATDLDGQTVTQNVTVKVN